jgi:hypothetical protein
MTDILRYETTDFINFRDYDFEPGSSHCFQWIDIKMFHLAVFDAGDQDILDAVIHSVEFRDDYVGGGVDPNGNVHGPYWLDRITANSYVPVDTEAVLSSIHDWTRHCGTLPSQLQKFLNEKVTMPIQSAASRYELVDLDKSAKNDYADIHNEYHEFVLINRSAGHVALLVATDD